MRSQTVIKANIRQHKGTYIGLFFLVFFTCMLLCMVVGESYNAYRYEEQTLLASGYGDVSAWTLDKQKQGKTPLSYVAALKQDIMALEDVENVETEAVIFTPFRVKGKKADNEVQIKEYTASKAYPVLTKTLLRTTDAPAALQSGECYVPVSFYSMFGARIGDAVTVYGKNSYRIQGFFEDPQVGSSLMGMKQIFISGTDFEELEQQLQIKYEAAESSSAGEGCQFHIFQKQSAALSPAAFQKELNEKTALRNYTSAVYPQTTVKRFMLSLVDIFSGVLGVFTLVLFVVSMTVLGHSIDSSMKQNYVDLGILKVIGFTKAKLQYVQLLQYLLPVVSGMCLGMAGAVPLLFAFNRSLLPVIGIFIPSDLPVSRCLALFAVLLLVLSGFILVKTQEIGKISPIRAIRGGMQDVCFQSRMTLPIHRRGLSFWLSYRQLIAGKREYRSVCVIAVLLAFFLALAGRMDAWIGPDGSGMMQSFQVADYTFAVAYTEEGQKEAAEKQITSDTPIAETFQIRMVTGGTVGDMDAILYSISDPEQYHILKGKTCAYPNEIVLTPAMAETLDASIGDCLKVTYAQHTADYTVSGIYACANDMGQNFGMSKDGFARIQNGTERFSQAYVLADASKKETVLKKLGTAYGSVDTNDWSGAATIAGAMRLLMKVMYGMTLVFILLVILLTGKRILYKEQNDLGIYKSLGFCSGQLRMQYALRYGMVSLFGAIIGTVASDLFTDPLVGAVLSRFGVSRFQSSAGIAARLFPGIVIVGSTVVFAYAASQKIKTVDTRRLIVE